MFFNKLFALLLLFSSPALAQTAEKNESKPYMFEKKITQAMVIDLMENIKNTYNSRQQNTIESFFKYYTDPDARFIKTTYAVDADNPDTILHNEGTNYSRNEFIKALANYLKTPEKYFYRYSDVQFTLQSSPTEALVSYHYDEISINQSLKTPTAEKFVKTLASANCNMNVQLSGIGLKIMGCNCIVKNAKKPLEIDLP